MFYVVFSARCSGLHSDISAQPDGIDSERSTTQDIDRQLFVSKTGIELPAASRVLHFGKEEGGELYVRTKEKMDADTFKVWVNTFLREEKDFSEDKRYLLEPDNKDWLPSQEKAMFAEQVLFEEGKILNIGFVNVEGDEKLVYISFHRT